MTDRAGGHFSFIYSDSLEALSVAFPGGLPNGVALLSSSPAMLLGHDGPPAKSFEPPDASHLIARIDAASRILSRSLHEKLRGAGEDSLALVTARWAIASQLLIYRAASMKPEYLSEPFCLLEIDTDHSRANSVYNGAFGDLIRSCDHGYVRKARVNWFEPADPPVPAFRYRLGGANLAAIVCKLALKAGSALRWLGIGGEIAVIRECELLRAAVSALAMRGKLATFLPLPPINSSPIDEQRVDWVCALAEVELRSATSGILADLQLSVLSPVVLADLRQLLYRRLNAQRTWEDWGTRPRSRRVKAILTNSLGTPEADALCEVAGELGQKVIMFQHGVTAEICSVVAAYEAIAETTMCHAFLTFNEAATRLHNSNHMRLGKAYTVGAPSIYQRPTRPRNGVAPIWYISTAFYTGHWGLLHSGCSDRLMAEREIRVVREVLAELPHRVTFKPYPGLPYIDTDPVLGAVEGATNIDIERRRIDLQYLIADARIIVTSHASSTLGWALLSGRPVVHLEKPGEAAFDPNVRSIAENALFYFDMGREDGLDKMRRFLSQPIDVIETKWANGAARRQEFVKEYFDDSLGHGAGVKAADIVLGLARDHAKLNEAIG